MAIRGHLVDDAKPQPYTSDVDGPGEILEEMWKPAKLAELELLWIEYYAGVSSGQ